MNSFAAVFRAPILASVTFPAIKDIGRDQIRSIAKVTPLSMAAYALNSTIALIAIAQSGLGLAEVAWAFLAYGIATLVMWRYLRRAHHAKAISATRGVQRITQFAFLLALPWGILASGFLGTLTQSGEFLVVTLTVGMSGAGSLLLAPVFPAAITYAVVILLPCLIKAVAIGTSDKLYLAILIISFAGFLYAVVSTTAKLSIERSKALLHLGEADGRLREMNQWLQNSASTRTLQLEHQQIVLSNLMRNDEIRLGTKVAAMRVLVEALGLQGGVDRCGFWLLNDKKDAFALTEVFVVADRAFVVPQKWDTPERIGIMLRKSSKQIVAIDDVTTANPLSNLTEDYFKPIGIVSTLQAPVVSHGELVGFLTCSTVRRRVEWSVDHKLFAAGIANLAALVLERNERLEVERSLEHANQTKNRFLANMSHEIRTPLNGVFGMADLLSRTVVSAQQRKLVETIQQSSRQLLGIVDDILDVSRIEKTMLVLDTHEFDLDSCVEGAVELLADLAREKNIALNVSIDEPLRGATRGDSGRLRQVLVNLVGNAIKFTPSGEVSVRVSTAEEGASETLVRFEISDTGIGIDSAVQSGLFKPFAQADSSISRRFGGTGLGLAISQQLVSLMGGDISLTSAPDQGTLVSFTLRFSVKRRTESDQARPVPDTSVHLAYWDNSNSVFRCGASGASKTSPASAATVSWKQRLNWNILVAEDNPVNQIVAEEYLRGFDCSVTIVENGALAVAAFEGEPFDLILMDCQMPEMDGLTATKMIRALEREQNLPPVPIIAVTAHAREEDRQDCMDAGMNGFVSKPYCEADLAIALQQWGPR